jgi:hypothetical protein
LARELHGSPQGGPGDATFIEHGHREVRVSASGDLALLGNMSWNARKGECMPSFHRAAAAALLALVVLASPVAAGGIGWCKTDPVLLIDRQITDLVVSAPLDAVLAVTGPTRIVVTLPIGVDGTVVLQGPGFGRGEAITFAHSRKLRVTEAGVEVRIAVYVPANDKKLPIAVDFAPRVLDVLDPVHVSGTANKWVILTAIV